MKKRGKKFAVHGSSKMVVKLQWKSIRAISVFRVKFNVEFPRQVMDFPIKLNEEPEGKRQSRMTPLSKILQAHALNSDVVLATVKISVNRSEFRAKKRGCTTVKIRFQSASLAAFFLKNRQIYLKMMTVNYVLIDKFNLEQKWRNENASR